MSFDAQGFLAVLSGMAKGHQAALDERKRYQDTQGLRERGVALQERQVSAGIEGTAAQRALQEKQWGITHGKVPPELVDIIGLPAGSTVSTDILAQAGSQHAERMRAAAALRNLGGQASAPSMFSTAPRAGIGIPQGIVPGVGQFRASSALGAGLPAAAPPPPASTPAPGPSGGALDENKWLGDWTEGGGDYKAGLAILERQRKQALEGALPGFLSGIERPGVPPPLTGERLSGILHQTTVPTEALRLAQQAPDELVGLREAVEVAKRLGIPASQAIEVYDALKKRQEEGLTAQSHRALTESQIRESEAQTRAETEKAAHVLHYYLPKPGGGQMEVDRETYQQATDPERQLVTKKNPFTNRPETHSAKEWADILQQRRDIKSRHDIAVLQNTGEQLYTVDEQGKAVRIDPLSPAKPAVGGSGALAGIGTGAEPSEPPPTGLVGGPKSQPTNVSPRSYVGPRIQSLHVSGRHVSMPELQKLKESDWREHLTEVKREAKSAREADAKEAKGLTREAILKGHFELAMAKVIPGPTGRIDKDNPGLPIPVDETRTRRVEGTQYMLRRGESKKWLGLLDRAMADTPEKKERADRVLAGITTLEQGLARAGTDPQRRAKAVEDAIGFLVKDDPDPDKAYDVLATTNAPLQPSVEALIGKYSKPQAARGVAWSAFGEGMTNPKLLYRGAQLEKFVLDATVRFMRAGGWTPGEETAKARPAKSTAKPRRADQQAAFRTKAAPVAAPVYGPLQKPVSISDKELFLLANFRLPKDQAEVDAWHAEDARKSAAARARTAALATKAGAALRSLPGGFLEGLTRPYGPGIGTIRK